jgi:hypothetical protein
MSRAMIWATGIESAPSPVHLKGMQRRVNLMLGVAGMAWSLYIMVQWSAHVPLGLLLGGLVVRHLTLLLGELVLLEQMDPLLYDTIEPRGPHPTLSVVFAPGNHGTGAQAFRWCDRSRNIRAVTRVPRSEAFFDMMRTVLFPMPPSPPILNARGCAVWTIEAAPAKVRDLGGWHDANLFADQFMALLEHPATPKTRRFLLVGVSRGSATIFNAVGIMARRPYWLEQIRHRIAGVLMIGGPFDRADNVAERRLHVLVPTANFLWAKATLRPWFDWWFPGYAKQTREKKVHPLNQCGAFCNARLPHWIIASRADTVVPPENIQPVIDALEKANVSAYKPKVLWLEHADHDFSDLHAADSAALVAFMTSIHVDVDTARPID